MDLTGITKNVNSKVNILPNINDKQKNRNLKAEITMKRVFILKYLCFILFAFIFSQPLVAQYTLQDSDVRIVDGVIDSCLYNFEQTDIIIPETLQGQTVVEIGDPESGLMTHGIFAFKGITSVKLPSTLEYIGYYAFRDNSITTLDLSNCTSLKYIITESFCRNNISSINFKGCSNLEYIGNNAFRVNYLTSIDFEGCSNLKIIGVNSFSDNSLSSVDITECVSLELINFGAFSMNPGLEGVTLPVSEKPGYILSHWLANSGGFFAGGDTYTNLSTSYTAVFSLATYTITYNTDGGIHSNILEYTMEYTPVTLYPATKEGYIFLGWFDNAEFTGDAITELAEGSYGDIELWAYFVTAYAITYNTDGGTHSNPVQYAAENNTVLTDATKDGYEFLGWFDNAEFTGAAITEIAEGTTGDLEFWAKWQIANGISDYISDQINIFPNPVREKLVINHKNIAVENISIMSTTGQILFFVSKLNPIETSVDMVNYKAGLYYVVLTTTNGELATKKVIKTN